MSHIIFGVIYYLPAAVRQITTLLNINVIAVLSTACRENCENDFTRKKIDGLWKCNLMNWWRQTKRLTGQLANKQDLVGLADELIDDNMQTLANNIHASLTNVPADLFRLATATAFCHVNEKRHLASAITSPPLWNRFQQTGTHQYSQGTWAWQPAKLVPAGFRICFVWPAYLDFQLVVQRRNSTDNLEEGDCCSNTKN